MAHGWAALGGLTLVFLGVVVSTYQSIVLPTTEVTTRYRCLVGIVGADFLLSLLCVGAPSWWLIDYGTLSWLYPAAVVLFLAQLAGLGAATVCVVWRLPCDGARPRTLADPSSSSANAVTHLLGIGQPLCMGPPVSVVPGQPGPAPDNPSAIDGSSR